MRSSRRHKRLLIGGILLAILLLAALDCRLKVQTYRLDMEELSAPVRIVLITDLHSCRYGDGQKQLIEAVHARKPDLVLLGGDIFDDKLPNLRAEQFLSGIANAYPCYYVTGNHEHWSTVEDFAAQMAILEKYDIPVLSGVCETLTIRNQTIQICGVDDPDVYGQPNRKEPPLFENRLRQVRRMASEDVYTILLSHRPEYFDAYAACGFDLVLSGHAHGGQWRIPGLLNGLFAPDQGLFPQYAGGKYQRGNTTMIVSRGLARESTLIPRIFNRPELVVIELT